MNEITVKSQKEFDAIPIDYNGRIYIEFGTPFCRAVVNRKFKFASVVAWGNSRVVARENSRVVAWENSSVVAWENSSVEARGNSSVEARGNSRVEAWGNSRVEARENSSVEARENSSVEAWENSSVVAWENSSVEARENSSVEARGNSRVVARENSSVVAWENSSVEAWENSSVEARENSSVEAWGNSRVVARENSRVVAWGNSRVVARGNSQVCDSTNSHNITTSGNARIVYNPRNIDEYCEHFQIERTETTVKLYKAVHKQDGRFVADHDKRFEYVIGEIAVADRLTTSTDEDCGHGIHMAHKAWCIDYGRKWEDLAIIEVEAEASGVIVPVPGCGKVRSAQVKVLREVPLEECGLLGKMLAKNRGAK